MDRKELILIAAVLSDTIHNLDKWSVYNDDYINEEVAALFEIGGKIFTKIQAIEMPEGMRDALANEGRD